MIWSIGAIMTDHFIAPVDGSKAASPNLLPDGVAAYSVGHPGVATTARRCSGLSSRRGGLSRLHLRISSWGPGTDLSMVMCLLGRHTASPAGNTTFRKVSPDHLGLAAFELAVDELRCGRSGL